MIRRVMATLRSRRGFTLIEMITALSVSSLLLLGIIFVLPSFIKIHAKSIDLSYAKAMSNAAEEALKNELSFASRISVADGGTTLTYTGAYGEKNIDGTSGLPQIEGLSYDTRYYMNKRMFLSFSLDASLCTVHITVQNFSGDTLYQTQRSIRAHGLPANP